MRLESPNKKNCTELRIRTSIHTDALLLFFLVKLSPYLLVFPSSQSFQETYTFHSLLVIQSSDEGYNGPYFLLPTIQIGTQMFCGEERIRTAICTYLERPHSHRSTIELLPQKKTTITSALQILKNDQFNECKSKYQEKNLQSWFMLFQRKITLFL